MKGDRISGLGTGGRAMPSGQVADSYRSLQTIDAAATDDDTTEKVVWTSQLIDSIDDLDEAFNFAVQFAGTMYSNGGGYIPTVALYWQNTTAIAAGSALDTASTYPKLATLAAAAFTNSGGVPDPITPFILFAQGRITASGSSGKVWACLFLLTVPNVAAVTGALVGDTGVAGTANAGITVDLSKPGRLVLTVDGDNAGMVQSLNSVVGHVGAKRC